MNYQQCLQRMYALNRYQKIKYDLDNVRKLAELYGNPQDKLEVVHVTGTNGKGSVAFKVAQLLQTNGHRTGMFTSPHLSTFRERMQVDGKMVSREFVTEFVNHAFQKREELNLAFSFFELLTVMAFFYFQDQKTDFVSLEVGIGGRLDCTNIVSRNKLAVITAVGLDHCEILGNTEAEITWEKCGIIRPGSPAVIGPNVDRGLVGQYCRQTGSPLVTVEAEEGTSFFEINNRIARRCGEVLNDHWQMNLELKQEVLERNLPGRAEGVPLSRIPIAKSRRPEAVYLDVGHNPMAVKFFCDLVRKRHPGKKVIAVFGTSGLKNSEEMLRTIRDTAEKVYLIHADSPRAKHIEVLVEEAARVGREGFECIEAGSVSATLTHIFQQEDLEDRVLIVCGSFFLMPQVRAYFGYEDETDELFLNEFSLETVPQAPQSPPRGTTTPGQN